MEIKRKGLWTVVAIALAFFTVRALFSGAGISPAMLLEVVKRARPGYLIPAALGMFGFIFFEGEAILFIVTKVGYPRSHRRGFIYGASDVYFSAITPSASGGQPASAFFMIRDKIPVPVATAALLLNLIMYTLAVLLNGAVCLIAGPHVFLRFDTVSRVLIVLGFVTLAGLGVTFFLLLFHPKLPGIIMGGIIKVLTKLHLMRHPDKWRHKLDHALTEYGQCVRLMRSGKRLAAGAFALNLLQRMSQISVSVFVYLALGGSPSRLWEIWMTQSMCVLGSNCVPIPGAMGVTEYLMLRGYQAMMDTEQAFHLEILSRGFSFYFCVVFSGLATLAGYFLLKRRGGVKK